MTSDSPTSFTVFLDANGDGILEPDEASTTTDPDGNYQFLVAPVSYRVRVLVPPGFQQTTPDPAVITDGRG